MNTGFRHRVINGTEILTVDSFEATGLCRCAFSTRVGGVSEGGLARLNLGLTRGDDAERVRENYRRFLGAAGIDEGALVLTAQTHTDNLRQVGAADAGRGYSRPGFADVDGLVTDDPAAALVAFFADCVPVLLLDPVRRAAACVHSGWRGTEKHISARAVELMGERFGSRAGDLLAAVGPSAGPCCYEVDSAVADRLRAACGDCAAPAAKGKYMADLWAANVNVLEGAGVKAENITVCGECTVCGGELYYSHRRQGNERGSLAAVIQLKGDC